MREGGEVRGRRSEVGGGTHTHVPRILATYVFWLLLPLGPLAMADEKAPVPARPVPEDAYVRTYRAYDPGFRFEGGLDPEEKQLSTEPRFYTLTDVRASERANALVKAADERAAAGRYVEAIEIYQKVIDKYPEALYRVSAYGVFVPVTQVCQRRMQAFPAQATKHYRDKYDARAAQSFELAWRNNSLEGLANIRDIMLCTSYGRPALTTLGMSALDRGHYLEALQYFEAVWEGYPEARTGDPRLPYSMELCRRMLGTSDAGGLSYGLAGHWTFDEGKGYSIHDLSGNKSHAGFSEYKGDRKNVATPAWIPGKQGTCLAFSHAGITIRNTRSLQLGVGGSNFSVAFWMWWEHGARPNHVFAKRRGDEQIHLEVSKGKLKYTIATRAERWETGLTHGPIPGKKWVHVAFVKAGNEVRVFLNGKLDVRRPLQKPPALPNRGNIVLGGGMQGRMDDVRVYSRALRNREAAALAGTIVQVQLTAAPLRGEAPLPVQMSIPAPSDGKAEILWEFGDGETGRGASVRHTYKRGGEFTAIATVTQSDGTIGEGRASVNVEWPAEHRLLAGKLRDIVHNADPKPEPFMVQSTSAPNVAADDYALFPPTDDPLGLKQPVWEKRLWARAMEGYVFTQPVVTDNSLIYRHANVLYCRSILNGELRWRNDTGGRVRWQSPGARRYPMEDTLVQDGKVFTPMRKVGPTLVALDEITGQIAWAYGPMVAGSEEEIRMRFETAPAGGPMTVFAGYILDNIQGETHIDTEYGLMAFDSPTGRVKWRTPLCRLRPGLFAAGFATRHRNRIRSFQSPPLYHEGTVYYCTDAGAVAAVDALSGEVRWLMKYPYNWDRNYSIHDATRGFGKSGYNTRTGALAKPHDPMFWYNQRPLLIGDALYITPVDAPYLYRLDRTTGKVDWRARRAQGVDTRRTNGGAAWFMGEIASGELAVAYSFRNMGKGWQGPAQKGGVYLLDPDTGGTLWESGDMVAPFENATLKYHVSLSLGEKWGAGLSGALHNTAARPFLSRDNKIHIPYFAYRGWPYHDWFSFLAVLDLNKRERTAWRRYVTPHLIDAGTWAIGNVDVPIKKLESLPHKDDKVRQNLAQLQAMAASSPPQNRYPDEMRPFSRVTFDRFGTRFELRMGAASVGMVYDAAQVKRNLAAQSDAEALFARAELAVAEDRLVESVALMEQCLQQMSSEDLASRAMVNQLLYQVHKRLARDAAFSRRTELEKKHCFGMSRSVGTLADEIETWLAFSDAHVRAGHFERAATQLQTVIRRYAGYEYPISTLTLADAAGVQSIAGRVLQGTADFAGGSIFDKEITHVMRLLRRGIDFYLGELTPVEKDCTMRADDLAVARLLKLKRSHEEVAQSLEKAGRDAFANARTDDERIGMLSQYPETRTAQSTLDKLLAHTVKQEQRPDRPIEDRAVLRRRQWQLADMARIAALQLPAELEHRLTAPREAPREPELPTSFVDRETDMEEPRGTMWLVLERRGQREREPDLYFLGGRYRTKVDNKFVLYCMDAVTGKRRWKASELRAGRQAEVIRLRGKGDEPGFFEAFVYRDLVVVHGRYDVLAFRLADGKLAWRYAVPFDFEIRNAEMSGNLLALAGESATIVLYLGTTDPRGEVAWQQQEEGDRYAAPYFCGDKLVSVRKLPFNLTVRYRSTGKLIGRLALPDLTLFEKHPLLAKGSPALPMAHDGNRLLLSDGWYYILLDVDRLQTIWKRRIDANDPSRNPAMRFELGGDYLAVIKEDYDVKAIYMLSSRTGEVLWRTDPKRRDSPQPIHSMRIADGKLYGIRPHAGQGFYFTGMDCKTGKHLFRPNEQTGYEGKPEVVLRPRLHGNAMVARIRDRMDFELRAFSVKDGKRLHAMKLKAAGDFGLHGRASATAQDGRLLLLGKNTLLTAHPK